MQKDQVIVRLCQLSRRVMEEKFHCAHAADCICPNKATHPMVSFDYSEKVLEFIETAVKEKLSKR